MQPTIGVLPSMTPQATPRPLPVLDPQEITPIDQDFHGAILFTSSRNFPFTEGDNLIATQVPRENWGRIAPTTWAVSVDGRRIGRLNTNLEAAEIVQSPRSGQKWLLTTLPISVDNEPLIVRRLPEAECAPPSPIPAAWAPCSNFSFSPNEQWFAFEWGIEACGTGLAVMSTRTSEVIQVQLVGVHSFRFLTDNQLLITSGHCEGGGTSLFDLESKQLTSIGRGETYELNGSNTAIIIHDIPYHGPFYELHGYNLVEGRPFLEAENHSNRPIWTPDGTQLIYQYRPVVTSDESMKWTFPEPRRIIGVDIQTGETRILASDPDYDYNLCCSPLQGDWIQVRRFKFQAETTKSDILETFDNPIIQCRIDGSCPQNPEYYALNWRAGELVPWEQSPISTLIPTATRFMTPTAKPVPDLSVLGGQEPIYRTPDGQYAFYEWAGSLWLVPKKGEPSQWTTSGTNYTYIP